MNEPAPPLAETVAEPFDPPLQETFVCEATEDEIPEGSVMFTVCACVQEFASVIVHVYVPAESPLAVAAVPPLGDHA